MRQKAIEFLKSICKNDGKSCVNYKPYEYGHLIESIPFSVAVDKFMKDYEEMEAFAECYNLKDKAFEMTCNMWRKQIVIF